MWKRGRIVPSWKRRWAVVRAGCLCYFADADELMLKGSLTLKGANCRLVQIAAKDSPRSLGPQLGFQVEVGTQVLLGFPAGATVQVQLPVRPRPGTLSRRPWVCRGHRCVTSTEEV